MTVALSTDVLASRLRLMVMHLTRRLRQEVGSDITLSQLAALGTVSRRGPLSLKELAEVERVSPPSMTRISTCLEERGLVERSVDAADRRVARLAITDSGRLLLETTRSRRDAYLAARLQALSAEDLEALERALPVLERLIGDEAP